jgi:hypothetical protein
VVFVLKEECFLWGDTDLKFQVFWDIMPYRLVNICRRFGAAVCLRPKSIPRYVYFQLRTAVFKTYCAIWVRCSNFRHQASPRV